MAWFVTFLFLFLNCGPFRMRKRKKKRSWVRTMMNKKLQVTIVKVDITQWKLETCSTTATTWSGSWVGAISAQSGCVGTSRTRSLWRWRWSSRPVTTRRRLWTRSSSWSASGTRTSRILSGRERSCFWMISKYLVNLKHWTYFCALIFNAEEQ